jgi:hypothetical protein
MAQYLARKRPFDPQALRELFIRGSFSLIFDSRVRERPFLSEKCLLGVKKCFFKNTNAWPLFSIKLLHSRNFVFTQTYFFTLRFLAHYLDCKECIISCHTFSIYIKNWKIKPWCNTSNEKDPSIQCLSIKLLLGYAAAPSNFGFTVADPGAILSEKKCLFELKKCL